MSDPKTVVEHQIRPDGLMAELGVKKDAYYQYLKFLGIKASRDADGKAYLEPEQANEIRQLKAHVDETGKMDGFAVTKPGDIALAQSGERGQLEQLLEAATGDDVTPEDLRRIIYGAGELKSQELILHQAIQQELAAQMTYEDLPEELQTKVREFRENSGPKFNPTEAASALLGRWRAVKAEQAAKA